MPFNEEKLVRKIFSCSIPIVSAVGHETDITLCDFVSDLRAPTPSAAAEIIVPERKEILIRFEQRYRNLFLSYTDIKANFFFKFFLVTICLYFCYQLLCL